MTMMLRHHAAPTRWLLAALAVVLAATGLTVAAAQSPEAGERTMTLSAYFLRETERGDPTIGTAHREIAIPADKAVAAAALRELLAGPTEDEEDAGLSTAIPAETELIDLALESETKIVTVDLSRPFIQFEDEPEGDILRARVAQVVYTLTQFPTIETVAFAIDGQPVDRIGDVALDEPVGRVDFDDVTPLIFVESPAPGDTVSSPIRVWGTANTFEATFIIDVRDANDEIVANEVVTATSGSGTRGAFDVEIALGSHAAGDGAVIAYEISARDGGRENVVEIPVVIES
ncbi:MAG: Gmad2 immunoglobulin-like domain-containing protein [Thermomicrobiales bacterium]